MEENRETNIVMSKKVVRKRKRSNTDENDVKRWSDLPSDLMECIKKRLFYSDHCEFSAVCKSWSSIEEKEEERILVPPLRQMPWLLVFDKPDSCTLVDSKYKKRYTVDMKSIREKMNISSFDKIQCHESKYGWLLISNESSYSTSLFLYSPFLDVNNNCIELPYLGCGICVAAAFTSNPLDDDCTVVALNTAFPTNAIIVHTYCRGYISWNSLVLKCDQFSLSHVKHWMYTDEGIFYYVIGDGRVGTLDLAREEWKVFPPLPTTMEATLRTLFRDDEPDVKVYMVKSNDKELFLINEESLSKRNKKWWCSRHHICRLDLSSMVWENLSSIGDRVLFIGNGYNRVLKSSVLKLNGEQNEISDMIYYCYGQELKYCSVHDFIHRNTDRDGSKNQAPPYNGSKRQSCARPYGPIATKKLCKKMLIDPPPSSSSSSLCRASNKYSW